MINYTKSQIKDSGEGGLLAATVLTDDGQALISTISNGVAVLAPSAGQAGEKFVGFGFMKTSGAPVSPTTRVIIETLVSDSGAVVLTHTPVANTTSVVAVNGSAVVLGTITGKSAALTTNGSDAVADDIEYVVTYRKTLTAMEAKFLAGDGVPGDYAGYAVGQVGYAKSGVIYVSTFDTAVNWATATGVKLAAGGRITNQAGSGVAINARVVEVPSADSPFLGLEFSAFA